MAAALKTPPESPASMSAAFSKAKSPPIYRCRAVRVILGGRKENRSMDLEAEEKEMARLVAEMRSLNRDSYYDQDIIDRIDQARMVLELEKVDPRVWSDDGTGISVSDVLCDTSFEIRRLRREIRRIFLLLNSPP
jgi:hypothetical protein